jgi:D-alanyl-D-alanine carboxypeptidase/D-alanyl-D-alanine-endopeptidase (penicillin-binding protein 4)
MKIISKTNFALILVSLALSSANVFANEKTDKSWLNGLSEQGLNKNDQAYCYTNSENNIEGANLDLSIRLASVSKLVTSLWSIESLGINFKYDTKLFIKNNQLHIQGSYDPFLGNEKMFYLLSQLNELGYTKFDKITFDKNLLVNPDAAYESDEYPNVSANFTTRLLKMYFNPKTWSKDFKDEFANYKLIAKEGRYREQINFEVNDIQFVDSNPFLSDSDVKVLTLSSPPLYKYLKEMNVKSNNYVAETLFRQNGNVKKFDAYLLSKFNLNQDTIKLITGSGLPYYDDQNVRHDNYATCRVMLKILKTLKSEIEKQNMTIEDVVAVPGSDKGTFRNRIFPSDFKNSFVAKTGTLMHTSALAGAMNTQSGFNFFGIFNQSTDIQGSKKVQNEMVKTIMESLGGPKSFEYVVDPFHAYSNDVLKAKVDEENTFDPIEGNLE